MKTQRVDEYRKHGCHFYGKLVVVDYYKEMKNDWGRYNAGITYDYIALARKFVEEKGYTVERVLLAIPEMVVEVA